MIYRRTAEGVKLSENWIHLVAITRRVGSER